MSAAILPAVTLRQAEALVGLVYVPGRFDCMHLALLAQQRLWGRAVAPQLAGRHPLRGDKHSGMVAQWRDQLADRVDAAESGAAILFHDAHGAWPWHVGTALLEAGECWVLHTNAAAGTSVLERLPDALRRGLRVEGYYRWRVAP